MTPGPSSHREKLSWRQKGWESQVQAACPTAPKCCGEPRRNQQGMTSTPRLSPEAGVGSPGPSLTSLVSTEYVLGLFLSLSHVRLCNPMDCSTPGFLSFTVSQNLLRLMGLWHARMFCSLIILALLEDPPSLAVFYLSLILGSTLYLAEILEIL